MDLHLIDPVAPVPGWFSWHRSYRLHDYCDQKYQDNYFHMQEFHATTPSMKTSSDSSIPCQGIDFCIFCPVIGGA
jgi:hypothetical protein